MRNKTNPSTEEKRKMNTLIVDKLNGYRMRRETTEDQLKMTLDPLYNSESERFQRAFEELEIDIHYEYCNKWGVDSSDFSCYVNALSLEDINNIYRLYWGEDIPGYEPSQF